MEKKPQDIIEELATASIQRYVREQENADVRNLVLKHKAILGIPARYLFEQVMLRRKAKEKLPLYYKTVGVVFPPSANFEQSSSEAAAAYKSAIIEKQHGGSEQGLRTAADLTGGFGVDTYFLSRSFHTIHYVEPQRSLLKIARQNHQLLGARNIEYHQATADEFLRNVNEPLDLVYVDPSRRSAANNKVHAFEDCQPDVVKLQRAIFDRSPLMLIKASPLLDIHAAMAQLYAVRRVYVVAVNNECRELLFLCDKSFSGHAAIEAVNIADPVEVFEFSFETEKAQLISYSDPLRYLYEPNAAILKAGAFKSIAHHFHLRKLAANTHLYTSEEFLPDFPGRKFLVEELVKPDQSALRRHFPEMKANVTTRNYPLTPSELRKKTGLKDGGEKFLFGFSGVKKKFLAVVIRQ